MKSWSLGWVFLFTGLTGLYGQLAAPPAVLQTLNTYHPQAKDVNWEISAEGLWQGRFKQDHQHITIVCEPSGSLRATKWQIKRAELPLEISQSANAKFMGYRIAGVERVERPDSVQAYELHMRKALEDWRVLFSPQGDIIRKKRRESENKAALREH